MGNIPCLTNACLYVFSKLREKEGRPQYRFFNYSQLSVYLLPLSHTTHIPYGQFLCLFGLYKIGVISLDSFFCLNE